MISASRAPRALELAVAAGTDEEFSAVSFSPVRRPAESRFEGAGMPPTPGFAPGVDLCPESTAQAVSRRIRRSSKRDMCLR